MLKAMAHDLDWSMVRALELTALEEPPSFDEATAAVPPALQVPIYSEALITLQVGERRFTALPSTLSDRSQYFAAFFSGLSRQTKLADGALFIDGDGDSFEHLLRYLRLKVKPLFWSHKDGFDVQKYQALQVTADYFGVEGLSEWIKDKMYHKAVTIHTSTQVLKDVKVGVHSDNIRVSYSPQPGLVKKSVCPLGSHGDDVERCRLSRDCRTYRWNNPSTLLWKDMDASNTLVVYEEAIVDWTKL